MTRVVTIGECMVEMAPSGAPGLYQMGFAGDTMNTAWYLRRLLPEAHQVDFLSAVGSDVVSDQMVAFLSEAGIGTDHIARCAALTVGLYMIQLQDGERSFSYWRGQSAARRFAQDPRAMIEALTDADIAYFSGITLAILPDPDRAQLLAALRDLRARGGEIVFDPNLRPRLWDSAKQMTSAVMEAAAISDTILPSHEDEVAWFGDSNPLATARRYGDAGAHRVVVKNGPGEILVMENGEISRHDPVAVARVVDTTAAGDSFNAGYLAGRIMGKPSAPSVRAAAELAARVVSNRGALVVDQP